MVNHYSDEGIREFLLEHLPKVTSFFKKVNISDDEALQDIFESEALGSAGQ
ncbi:hypothetical protein [Tatumella sp. OPLPL6]|uniref:hypothetical protein n=1 Tax=Tatumella sp. OPLPL6 TaxID=1928657 RepID=UPI0025703426|nr:hypothetical protein [Tatumella sp. OPLPL6]